MFLLLLLIALAPGLFLLWYFSHRDKYEPEPRRYLIKIYLLGAVMVVPALIIEVLLDPIFTTHNVILSALLVSFLLVAPVEEILKFFVVKMWIYNDIEFDEVMDGIVYGVSASLGFATVENIGYVFKYGIGSGIFRAFLAVPGHAFFGALMGYYLGRAKFEKKSEIRLISTGILLAILAHGFYDFFLLTKTVLAFLVIVIIITLGFITRNNLKKAEFQSKERKDKNSLIS